MSILERDRVAGPQSDDVVARRGSVRWTAFLIIFGLVLSGGLFVISHGRPGVFWTRVQVHFVAPKSARYPNVLTVSSASLISTAAVVAQKVDPYGDTNRMASESVTLADQGIRHGWSVTLPNTGGQWSNTFSEPWLDVEAVGENSSDVLATVKTLVSQVVLTLDSLQQASKVKPENYIVTEVSPVDYPVYLQQGSDKRVYVMALLLGFLVAGLLVGWIRRHRIDLASLHSRQSPGVSEQ